MYSHYPPAPKLSECGKWLRVNFDIPHIVKSWAVLGGGTKETLAVIWRQVTDGELCLGIDPQTYLIGQIEAHYGRDEASSQFVGFLTGARLAEHTDVFLDHSGIWARCIATVGLNNALRIGDPPGPAAPSPRRSDATARPYSSKHTVLGHLIGATTYKAVAIGVNNRQHRVGPVRSD